MVSKVRRGFSIGLLLLVVSLVANAQQAASPFYLTFIPNIQFAPIYVGIEAGYFQEAGQPIAVEYLNEPDVVDLIAAGQANYGIVSAEQVILAGANGRPITYVYNWFHDYPIAVVASVESGIASVADLEGRKVGVPMRAGATYTGLTALLESNGLTEDDIDLQEIGFNAPEAFCLGVVEATTVYINNEPTQIENLMAQDQCGTMTALTVFPVAEAVSLVSNGIITSNDFLSNNPDLVRSFVAAYHQALLDTINNPARAYLYSLAHVENLPISDELQAELEAQAAAQDEFLATNPTRDDIAASRETLALALAEKFDTVTLLQFNVLLNTIALWDTKQVGVTDANAWANMATVLRSLGQLEADDATITALYTNEFVPLVGRE